MLSLSENTPAGSQSSDGIRLLFVTVATPPSSENWLRFLSLHINALENYTQWTTAAKPFQWQHKLFSFKKLQIHIHPSITGSDNLPKAMTLHGNIRFYRWKVSANLAELNNCRSFLAFSEWDRNELPDTQEWSLETLLESCWLVATTLSKVLVTK